MQQEQLIKFIKSISRDKDQSIDPKTFLFKEKVLDSMNILDLMGYVEKYLGRKLTDNEVVMPNFESVHKIVTTFLKDND